MSVIYKWSVLAIAAYPELDSRQDVVVNAQWACNGSDIDDHGLVVGSCEFALDPTQPFTPYASLIEQQVLEWIWASGVDKQKVEALVAGQIFNKQNPAESKPLPWSKSSGVA